MDPTFLAAAHDPRQSGAYRAFKEKIADPLGMGVEEAAFGATRRAAAQDCVLIHEITVRGG